MAHLIDKDILVEEIKRRISNLEQLGNRVYIQTYFPEQYRLIRGYESLLPFLDTIEVKEINLDDFVEEEFNKHASVDVYGQLSVSYNMTEFYSMIKRLTKAQEEE